MSNKVVEIMARGIGRCEWGDTAFDEVDECLAVAEHIDDCEGFPPECAKCSADQFRGLANAALTALTTAGYVVVPRNPLMSAVASLAAAISLLERGGKKAAPSDKMFAIMLDDYRKALEGARAMIAAAREDGK